MKDRDNITIPEAAGGGKRGRAYRAYMLRCWREDALPGSEPAWRFSLEEILRHRHKRGFRSLEALFQFLKDALREDDANGKPCKP